MDDFVMDNLNVNKFDPPQFYSMAVTADGNFGFLQHSQSLKFVDFVDGLPAMVRQHTELLQPASLRINKIVPPVNFGGAMGDQRTGPRQGPINAVTINKAFRK